MCQHRPKSAPGTKVPRNGGIVLSVVLMYSLVFAFQGTGLSLYSMSTSRQIQSQENHLKTFYAAESGTEKLRAQIVLFFQALGRAPSAAELTAMQDDVPGLGAAFDLDDVDVAYNGAQQSHKLTSGDFAGLNGNVQELSIAIRATHHLGRHDSSVRLTQMLEIQQIPVFQFGVFYDKDLEILPGATMTFAGPVHSNGDIYAGGDGVTLNFDSGITAYKGLFHKRKDNPNAALTGNVFIKDDDSVDKNMKLDDGSWLDSDNSDWTHLSTERWGSNVRTSAHSTASLKVPLPVGSDARTLIVRRSAGDTAEVQAQKLDYKAHLRFVDGAAFNKLGAAVDLRYCTNVAGIVRNGPDNLPNTADDFCTAGTLKNPISNKTFMNYRENKTIRSMDIDVAVLNGSPAFQAIKATAVGGMIVYSSDRRNFGASNQAAIRLVNGAALPTGGMTVVSENPMYVKGDYNTIAKQPSGMVSDAFNILSNAWNDSNSTQVVANRVATNTTINTAVITGNTETTTGHYNGGFENIHRFLETWTGKTLTYKGSVIVLFNSLYATGLWGSANVYSPPNRNWSFDTAFSDPNYTIPGFPSVYTIVKSRWSME